MNISPTPLSVETIKDQENQIWGVYTSNGRDRSDKELGEWILEATERVMFAEPKLFTSWFIIFGFSTAAVFINILSAP